jgi:serine/threonine protein kinase
VVVTLLADRYELGARLGAGGSADVFAAEDRVLQRPVAVKVVRGAVAPTDRARFESEAVLLASLTHPGLVQIYDVGEQDGDAFVVLELIEGPSLAERLGDGPLPSEEVAALGVDLADVLAYIHAHGVVHRDVAPANILCAPDGHPRLADFGIARLVDSTRLTATGTTIGTAAYMAPEQVAGEEVTPAADVYALGLVLLELLTGRRAFPGSPAEAAAARLVRPPDTNGVPPDWRRLLTSMTARAPHERPSAREVRDRLPARGVAVPASTAAFTAILPVELAPEPPPARRRRWLVVPALAVLLLAAAAAVAVERQDGTGTGPPPSSSTTTSVPTTVAPTTTTTVAPAEAAPPGGPDGDRGKGHGRGSGKGGGKKG